MSEEQPVDDPEIAGHEPRPEITHPVYPEASAASLNANTVREDEVIEENDDDGDKSFYIQSIFIGGVLVFCLASLTFQTLTEGELAWRQALVSGIVGTYMPTPTRKKVRRRLKQN